ncbi:MULTISPECIES: ectoine/hydroxyectoine ABC transporter substrate-binding protein EhuB [Streptomyces]|jgi:polar amino acid transport system substrate-binding protein|uniref:Ectoine/hydroxyectoine ABC transporter substrate-binding protein EhuB n=1 Tax=Streptomyces thermogriseus TaxID=75292 RepID=A0ABN1STE9_9ACTN|nr:MULTISPECIES: ectoine/hydroxyectoine ABC transporter substrate-binding protein EhuB [Streptomyces]MDN5381015.1 ectoine/hydroxyectoine ABC transporter substrate-binding protein EhuB [Streptomyces sp. LB8]
MVSFQAHDEGSSRTHRPGPRRRALLTGVAALAAAGAVGASSGCSRVATADTGDGGRLLEQLRARGSVRLGIAGEQPYGYIGKDGKVTGSAPAVAARIFRRLGVERVEPFPTEFGSLILGLNSLQFDVVAAGMYINPERCGQVLFADPEYQMKDAFIVARGNPLKLHSYEDIARTGARMATGIGYAEIDYAKAAGVRKITTLPDQLAGLLAVEQGRVDVFAGTAVTVRNVLKQTRSTKAEATGEVTPYLNGKPVVDVGAFAFRRTERNLRDAFNRELHAMKRSGELLEVMRPFGFTEEQMTTLTAEEKCRP